MNKYAFLSNQCSLNDWWGDWLKKIIMQVSLTLNSSWTEIYLRTGLQMFGVESKSWVSELTGKGDVPRSFRVVGGWSAKQGCGLKMAFWSFRASVASRQLMKTPVGFKIFCRSTSLLKWFFETQEKNTK